MISRRQFLTWVSAGIVLTASPVRARDGGVPRIGFLSTTNPVGTPHYAAFLEGLREYGYIDGKNISIEHRWTDGNLEEQFTLATELVNLKVDLVMAWSSPSVAAAKRATSTIPIVMVAVSDPVGSGFVNSLAQPGGNVTGMSNMHRGTITKNIEMLKLIRPDSKRIAVLRNPTNKAHDLVLQEALAAARQQGVPLLVLNVVRASDLDVAFATIRREGAAGVVVFGDPAFVGQRQRIAELARETRVPSTTIFRQYPEAGGLMSYGLNTTDLFRRAAGYVDKILKGAKPGDLPVENPTTYEMVINLKTARALGIAIPNDVLLRANRVID